MGYKNKKDWEKFWGDKVKAYYVHGKDNIPFHTLILPALLLGLGNLHLPDSIISSEYLTIEGRKLSTSNNWAIWVPYMLERYHPDSIRYYLLIKGPEKGIVISPGRNLSIVIMENYLGLMEISLIGPWFLPKNILLLEFPKQK